MISFKGKIHMMKEDKSKRTQQIQFRMDPCKLKELKALIAYDDETHSMADLFNKAADEYIKKRNKIKNRGDKENG